MPAVSAAGQPRSMTTTPKNPNVLISGASVAGPALAYWLHRYGFRPTVVERAPGLRDGGYAVDFRGDAHLSVLRQMGILGDIERESSATRSPRSATSRTASWSPSRTPRRAGSTW